MGETNRGDEELRSYLATNTNHNRSQEVRRGRVLIDFQAVAFLISIGETVVIQRAVSAIGIDLVLAKHLLYDVSANSGVCSTVLRLYGSCGQ